MFCKSTADNGANDRPHGPSTEYQWEVLWSLPQRYDVAKDDLYRSLRLVFILRRYSKRGYIRVKVMIPPPPIPWMQRPVNIMVKSFDTAQRIVPTVKKRRETMSSCCRPNIWLIEAMTGWNMAEVRRYDVPAQKASTEVPLSLRAMSCCCS
jgi:hypothetical protein